jgi:hypothetical protein
MQGSLEAVAETLEVALADRVKTEIGRFSVQLCHILEQQRTEYRHLLQSAKTSRVVDSNQYVSPEYIDETSTYSEITRFLFLPVYYAVLYLDCSTLPTQFLLAEQ